MTEEEAFQAAISASPLDRLRRLVFADWLDEQGDDRAAGFRVLATFDRWPWKYKYRGYVWSGSTVSSEDDATARLIDNHGEDRSQLPDPWLAAIKRAEEERTGQRTLGNPRHADLKAAVDVAALAWDELTDAEQAECLAALQPFARD